MSLSHVQRAQWPLMAALTLVLTIASIALVARTPALPASNSATRRPVPFQTTTDERGHFRFDNLPRGSHQVWIDPATLPEDLQPAPDAPRQSLTLAPGASGTLRVVPFVTMLASYSSDGHTLSGVVFHDRNADGAQTADEPGLVDVTVFDPTIHQYYVPFNDDNLATAYNDVVGESCAGRLIGGTQQPGDTFDSIIALTASSPDTQVYYDHWEDGYDADPLNPAAGSTTETDLLAIGEVRIWRNNIPLPRNPANLLYDGRDRITIFGEPASVIRAAWLTDPGTVFAGAWEVPRVSDWGSEYIIPVGENLDLSPADPNYYGDFQYLAAFVMAGFPNTTLEIDANADGVFETTTTMANAGDTFFIRGDTGAPVALSSGAQIRSSQPVQVQLRGGHCNATFSGRAYSLVPVERWSTSYYSPLSGFRHNSQGCVVRLGANPPNIRVNIYMHNPYDTDLVVQYRDATTPVGTNGTMIVPPRSTIDYVSNHPDPNGIPSNTQGIVLIADRPFGTLATVDAAVAGNGGNDWDWSYSLLPAEELSPAVVLSWSPGSNANPPSGQVNGSAVFVMAVEDNSRVFVDLNADGTPDQFDINGDGIISADPAYGYNETTTDQGVVLNSGQLLRVSDPNDGEMTGANIYTNTLNQELAVVYGEDACRADVGQPFLDLGYTVLPLPIPTFSKSVRLFEDVDGSGDTSPGDILEYTLDATNNGLADLLDAQITDLMPWEHTAFVVGSLTSSRLPQGIAYDDGSNAFTYQPVGTLDTAVRSLRLQYDTISPGETVTIRYRVRIDNPLPVSVISVTNQAVFSSSNAPARTAETTTPINQVDLLISKSNGLNQVSAGQRLNYTLTYTNAGPGIAFDVVMTDTLPPGVSDVQVVDVEPGVTFQITPGVQQTVSFRIGTLQANQSGTAVISLVLDTLPPTGNVINIAEVNSRSSDRDRSNNTARDEDPPDTPQAVVLADFSASRGNGAISVRWRTALEINTYGFHVYRSSSPDPDTRERITPTLIRGSGSGYSGGRSYSFTDQSAGCTGGACPVYYYWLEEIDTNFTSTTYGPVRVFEPVFVPIVSR